ncbi:MAG: hypothetical protein RR014_05245, partial [Bilophila sp.]
MSLPLWIIAIVTVAESVLVALVFLFFLRLKRSEASLAQLQANQEQVLDRIYQNAALEQELVDTFSQRQEQLLALNQQLEERIDILRRLLDQAEGISRSPQFLREIIFNGRRKGQTPAQIARAAGLTVDEVEII